MDPSKPEYNPCLTVTEVLTGAGVSEEQYYWALSVSPDSDYELHLKRPTDSSFINNYFIAGIQGFATNVDLQPVFNHYKCITYVCSYFSKDETECSQAITNAVKEAKNSNLSIRESLRKVGAAFLSTREVSAQECEMNLEISLAKIKHSHQSYVNQKCNLLLKKTGQSLNLMLKQ